MLTLLLLLCFFGCAKTEQRSLFAMDTFITLQCHGKDTEHALDACEAEIRRLEGLLSATLQNSDISRLNAADGTAVTVDVSTAALLERANAIQKTVNGAFDISVRPLVELWGFPHADYRVPTQEEIDALLPHIGSGLIAIKENTVTLPDGMKLDLGGIAKGYCGEQLGNILREYGIESALLTLGGNIEAVGAKPDGSAWRVAIRDPQDEQRMIGVVSVRDCAVVTAGSYQRYFEQDGKRYHHILDPKTGYPADSGLCSVTVITKSGTRADALSTAFFVLGLDASLALLETEPFSDCEAIFVTNEGKVVCSDKNMLE